MPWVAVKVTYFLKVTLSRDLIVLCIAGCRICRKWWFSARMALRNTFDNLVHCSDTIHIIVLVWHWYLNFGDSAHYSYTCKIIIGDIASFYWQSPHIYKGPFSIIWHNSVSFKHSLLTNYWQIHHWSDTVHHVSDISHFGSDCSLFIEEHSLFFVQISRHTAPCQFTTRIS